MQKESVTVYTSNGCGKCVATKRALDNKKIKYEVKNISEDAAAYDYVTKKLGFNSMPVVETDSDVWTGLNPTKIANIK
jgi:glutaredoxin-like protein NrdH